MLKVVVVDDSLAIQRSFGRLLQSTAGVDVVGCAEEVAVAHSLIDATRPDVVVLDANLLGGEQGVGVLHWVAQHHPQTQVIVLTNVVSPEMRRAYLDAGARAYFDKSTEFMRARDWIAAHATHR